VVNRYSATGLVTFGQSQPLQVGFDLLYETLVFGIREIYLAGVHLERAAVVGAADILRRQVEVQMRQLVAVGTVVDLLGVEGFLHGTGHLGHVGHEGVAVVVAELVQVVHMVLVGHEAAATVGLLLEEEGARDAQRGKLDHQIVEGLIVLAVQALLGVTLHSCFCFRVNLAAKLRKVESRTK